MFVSVYLGAPVWGLKDWVGNFLPPKTKPCDFLSLYSQRLNTVEGNTTFYSLPTDRDAPLLCRNFHARVNTRFALPPLPEWGEEFQQGRLF